MRTTLAKRAVITAVAAAVTIGTLSTAASAAPEHVAGSSSAPSQLSKRAAALPPQLASAIERDLHISPEQYLQRSAIAQKLGSYAHDLHTSDPGAYAGAWLGTQGQPIVAVTTHEAAARVSKAGFQPKMAAISADSLQESLVKLNQWIAALPKSISSQIKSTAVDTLNNRLVVTALNSPVGRALSLPDVVAKVKVNLAPDPHPPVVRGPMGGDAYVTSKNPIGPKTPLNQIIVCSFGFSATDSSGDRLALSAGHCNPRPDATGTSQAAKVYVPNLADVRRSEEVGQFAASSLGGPSELDYSLIKLNSSKTNSGLDRSTVRGANGATMQVTGVASPVVGAPVCKSGQTSAYTCGLVLATNVQTQLYAENGSSRTVRGFADSACTLGGDSGGAIVTGTSALGITSGSNSISQSDCGQANLLLALQGGTVNFGIPVQRIIDHVNKAVPQGGVGSGLHIRTTHTAA